MRVALPLEDLIESAVQDSPSPQNWGSDGGTKTGLPPTRRSEESEGSELLSAADAARDARRWSDAAKGYRAVLECDPKSAPIWVQYGHMLKEAGQRDQARVAY